MSTIPPRARALLRQASQTASANKRTAAEQLYRQIITEFPDVADGWVGLAQVITNAQEKRVALERALALEPGHNDALDGLQRLDGTGITPTVVPPSAPVAYMAQPDPPPPVNEPLPLAPTPFGTPEPVAQAADTEELVQYCRTHPTVRTNLRCYSCGKLICNRCAKHTPVGWRCNTCIYEAQEVFFNAEPVHYLLAFMVSGFLALIGSFIVPLIGYFTIFLAAGVGTLIGRVAFRLAGRRRGRYLPHTIAAAVVIGGLIPTLVVLLISALATGLSGDAGFLGSSLLSFSLVWRGLYVVLAAGSAYYQVR